MPFITKPNPGDTCRFCHHGHLQARVRAESPLLREIPFGGQSGGTPAQRVRELVCGDCGLKFEPAELNKSVDDYLEDELFRFTKNPSEMPTACPKCRNSDLATTYDKTPSQRNSSFRDNSRERYRYCRHCLMIVWIFPETARGKDVPISEEQRDAAIKTFMRSTTDDPGKKTASRIPSHVHRQRKPSK